MEPGQFDDKQLKKMGETLDKMIKAGAEARKAFKQIGDDIYKYAYDQTYQFIYQDWESQNGQLFFKAKIPKAQEFIEVIGPYLYSANPTYTIERTQNDLPPDVLARFGVEERYLNYAARQTDQYTNCRRAVNDAACRGRGVIVTGYNPRKNCVASINRPVEDMIDDPDATCPEERNWIAFRRKKPRWELVNLFPEAAEKIRKLDKGAELVSETKTDRNKPVGTRSGGKSSEVIEYYEVYMRCGLGRYSESVAKESEDGQVDDSPMKYIVSDDQILDVTPWEIPFFRSPFDSWPASFLDLRQQPGSIYPAAPLEPCLGLIRCLNWSHTLVISQLQVTTRLSFALMNRNGTKMDASQVIKLIRGDHFDVASFDMVGNEGAKIGEMIQQLEIKNSLEDLERLNQMLETAIERSSGLYSILYAGQTPTQIRTAEDANLKDKNSQTRIEDMKTQTEKWATEVGAKARFAARFLEGSQDIAKLFGQQEGDAWGDLASPEEVEAWRDAKNQAGQFAAHQAMQQAAMAGHQIPPQMLQGIAAQASAAYEPNSLVDFDAWMLSSSCTIESGSMRRKDIDDAIDSYGQAGQTVVPALLSNPNPAVQAIGLEIQASYFQAAGGPPDLIDKIQQAAQIVASTPPPQPAQPEPGKGPAKRQDVRQMKGRPPGQPVQNKPQRRA